MLCHTCPQLHSMLGNPMTSMMSFLCDILISLSFVCVCFHLPFPTGTPMQQPDPGLRHIWPVLKVYFAVHNHLRFQGVQRGSAALSGTQYKLNSF